MVIRRTSGTDLQPRMDAPNMNEKGSSIKTAKRTRLPSIQGNVHEELVSPSTYQTRSRSKSFGQSDRTSLPQSDPPSSMNRSRYTLRLQASTHKSSCGDGKRKDTGKLDGVCQQESRDLHDSGFAIEDADDDSRQPLSPPRKRKRGISEWRQDWLVVKASLTRKFAKVSSPHQTKSLRTVAAHTSYSLKEDEDEEPSLASLSSDSDAEDQGDDDDGSESFASYTSFSSDLSASSTLLPPSEDDEDEYAHCGRAVSTSKPSVTFDQSQAGAKRPMTKTTTTKASATTSTASKITTSTPNSRTRRVAQPPPVLPNSPPAATPRTPSKGTLRRRSLPTSSVARPQPPRLRPPRQIRLKTGRWTEAEDQALYQGVVEYLAQHGLEPKPPGDLPFEKDLKLEKKEEEEVEKGKLDEKGVVTSRETLVLPSLHNGYDAAGTWIAIGTVVEDSTEAAAAYRQAGEVHAIYNQGNFSDGNSLTQVPDNDSQLFDELVDVSGNDLQADNGDDELFLPDAGEAHQPHRKAMLTSSFHDGSTFIDHTPFLLSDLIVRDNLLPCMAENEVVPPLAPEGYLSLPQQQQQQQRQQEKPQQLQLSSHQEHLNQLQQQLHYRHQHLYQQHHQLVQLRQHYQQQHQIHYFHHDRDKTYHRQQLQHQHQQHLQHQHQLQHQQQQQQQLHHSTIQWTFPILNHIDPIRPAAIEDLNVGGTNHDRSIQEHHQYNDHSFRQLQQLSVDNLSQLMLEHQYQRHYPNLQFQHQQHDQLQQQFQLQQQQFFQQQQIQQRQQQQQQQQNQQQQNQQQHQQLKLPLQPSEQQQQQQMYYSRDQDSNLNVSSLDDYHRLQPLTNRHSMNSHHSHNCNPATVVTSLPFWKEKEEQEKTPLMPTAQDTGGKMWFAQGGEGGEGEGGGGEGGKEPEGGQLSMPGSGRGSAEGISSSKDYTASAGSNTSTQVQMRTNPLAAATDIDDTESAVAEMMLLDTLLADITPPPPTLPPTTSSSSQGHFPPQSSESNNKHTTSTPQKTTSSPHSTHDSYTSAISRLLHTAPWSHIATSCVPGRTGVQAQARYSEALDPLVKKGPWSAEEDALLLEGVVKNQKCWIWIADGIWGRTQRQCRTRWVQLTVERERKAAEVIVAMATGSSGVGCGGGKRGGGSRSGRGRSGGAGGKASGKSRRGRA